CERPEDVTDQYLNVLECSRVRTLAEADRPVASFQPDEVPRGPGRCRTLKEVCLHRHSTSHDEIFFRIEIKLPGVKSLGGVPTEDRALSVPEQSQWVAIE